MNESNYTDLMTHEDQAAVSDCVKVEATESSFIVIGRWKRFSFPSGTSALYMTVGRESPLHLLQDGGCDVIRTR